MRRFTVVELMVAVAIVAVLAAIALALFMEASARAKYAEVRPNLDAIVDAQLAYMHTTPGVVFDGVGPPHWPGKALGPPTPLGGMNGAGYAAVGFQFDGDIRGRYWFSTAGESNAFACAQPPSCPAGSGTAGQLYASADSDVDGDGFPAYTIACECSPGTSHQFRVAGRTGQRTPADDGYSTVGAY